LVASGPFVVVVLSLEFLCLQVLSVWRAFGGYVTARGNGLGVDFVPHLVPNRDLLSFPSLTTLVNSHNNIINLARIATAIRMQIRGRKDP
jgi:hypothetical protein